MKKQRPSIQLISVATLAVLLVADSAAARRGVVMFGHLDAVEHIGYIQDSQSPQVHVLTRGRATTKRSAVGFIYSSFSILWLDAWTWNGRFCIYQRDGYWEISRDQAAALVGLPASELRKPLLYSFPAGLLAVILVGTWWAAIFCSRGADVRRRLHCVKAIVEDERYHAAFAIMQDHHRRKATATVEVKPEPRDEGDEGDQDDGGFGQAVGHLVDLGVKHDDAEENLRLFLAVVSTVHDRQQRPSSPEFAG